MVFASTGLVAFTLFLIQADILAALAHYIGLENNKKLPIQTSIDKPQRSSAIQRSDYQVSLDPIFPQLPSPTHRKDHNQDYAELESLENTSNNGPKHNI